MKIGTGSLTSLSLAGLMFLSGGLVVAAPPPPPLPSSDVTGSADSPLIKRYEGAIILSYEKKRFAEMSFPLSKLEMVPGKRNNGNNAVAEPKQKKTVEGEITHLLYVMPAERTPLEVIRNYQDEVKSRQGKVLYECKAPDCGGNPVGNSAGGGGTMGMAMYLRDGDQITDKTWSLPWCAQSVKLKDLRYMFAELPGAGAHLSVLTATMNDAGGVCSSLQGRALAVVDVVQGKARENKMVAVQSAEMARALASDGRIALYGIYFDSSKAEVKSTSEDTLVQIAKLMKENAQMKLLVVGHTDNNGAFSSNMDLSQKRAAAVVKALVERHGVKKDRLMPVGVSFAAPVGSNSTEEGRAKNRRVELVSN
jgi:outer membrane protein OmpA-like peptidoglycan-associated protein